MKHIKSINELHYNNSYYKEIEYGEYVNNFIEKDSWKDNEISGIRSLFSNVNASVTVSSSSVMRITGNIYLSKAHNNRNYNDIIRIFKCIDEWFYVMFEDMAHIEFKDDGTEFCPKFFFKCDQFEGLMKCLNDILN